MFSTLKNWLFRYLLLSAILAHLGLLLYVVQIIHTRDYSPREFLLKVGVWAGADASTVSALLYAAPDTQDLPQLSVKRQHPRLILPQLAGVAAEQRASLWRQRRVTIRDQDWRNIDPCGNSMLRNAACWLTQGDQQAAQRAITALLEVQVQQPSANQSYANGWELALSYDWIADYPGLSDQQRTAIEAKLELSLHYHLLILNADSASLWHGRTTLAAHAWLLAVALGAEGDARASLFEHAVHHFLSVLEAVELSEAWPEGYNYWINNRAFSFGLAAAAFINGLQQNPIQERVRQVLARTALWHVYATRPDNRVVALGDEGPRVDLAEETARFIDLAAGLTADPVLVLYAAYLRQLHAERAYFRGYRWWYPLLNWQTPLPDAAAQQALSGMQGLLPTAELFGRDALNLVLIRSAWDDPDATFISYRAGHSLTHHGHYDAGHFTLFKGVPMASDSGTYGAYTSEHRLHYGLRTVSKNSLLIMRPGERVEPNRLFQESISAGGQRITLATGSALKSVQQWRQNLNQGLHLGAASIDAFERIEGQLVYVASDLTAAYNTPQHDSGGSGGKVERVKRSLVYLPHLDRLLVYDQLKLVDPAYRPKWLLHTLSKPSAKQLMVLQGNAQNGILQTPSKHWLVDQEGYAMHVDTLLPEKARSLLIGGPDYRYYVDIDGDPDTLDGRNMVQGEKAAKWFDAADWRIEVEPVETHKSQRFLHLLSPFQRGQVVPMAARQLPQFKPLAHVLVDQHLLIFIDRDDPSELTLPAAEPLQQIILLGLPPWREVQVGSSDQVSTLQASENGVLRIAAGKKGVSTIAW